MGVLPLVSYDSDADRCLRSARKGQENCPQSYYKADECQLSESHRLYSAAPTVNSTTILEISPPPPQLHQTLNQATDLLPSALKPYEERLATCTSWLHSLPHPKDLAAAGFEYHPTKSRPDNVRCAERVINSEDWRSDHHPLILLFKLT